MEVAFLLYPGLTALDLIGPYEVFNSAEGFEIRFVWKERGPVMTDSGVLAVGATHTFSEVKTPDILLIPGSSAETTTMMADTRVLKWIREVHEHTRYTTSVCTGSLILAAAGILKGQPATSHWAGLSGLKQLGITPRPEDRYVQSGKVVTAAGVSAGIDMALYLLGQLKGEQAAKAVQLMIEYDPSPPFDCGHMSKADPVVIEQAKQAVQRRGRNLKSILSVPKILWNHWMKR